MWFGTNVLTALVIDVYVVALSRKAELKARRATVTHALLNRDRRRSSKEPPPPQPSQPLQKQQQQHYEQYQLDHNQQQHNQQHNEQHNKHS